MLFDQVPDEVIQHLLYFVPPEDTLQRFQYLSRRLNRLANEPLLWKYHCRTSFKFWNRGHNFNRKLREKASEVEWKQLYLLRNHQNQKISSLLDDILGTKIGRIRRVGEICQYGYDAKDFLLRQCHADDTFEDVLARRHYANAVLDSIHRSVAVEEWHNLHVPSSAVGPQSNDRVLERALGAFDLFVLHDQPGDLDDITHLLDELTSDFRVGIHNLDDLSTRQKALELARWLRINNLTGLQHPERSYRNLRNCLIGQALRHDDHESIPIISSAIYCCIAERLGMRAQCCAFPTHVHTIVFAEPNKTLDGAEVVKATSPPEMMYLDPYGSDSEVPLTELKSILSQFGWNADTDVFLAPVTPVSVALRTARNIRATSARVAELRNQTNRELTQLISGNDAINLDLSLYGALWASLMLTSVGAFDWDESLEPFLRRFAQSWHEDVWLIEKYICPLFDRFVPLRERLARNGPQGWDDPREILGLVRELDEMEPAVSRRDPNVSRPVPYKIGQVFVHRRYRWIGIINGWTDQGTRRLPMPHTVAIDETLDDNSDTELPRLVRPRSQNFYTCLRTTGPERHVVAEDNIELINNSNEVPHSIFPLAGKFFKRFDASTCTFISNIKEQYPDD